MNRIKYIEDGILDLRKALNSHEMYEALSSVDDIKIFMEKHVYAVWDFMSLLKALQMHLTTVTLPWKPVANAKTARFINEIVHGEESDINENKVPRSHFEMYLDAMKEVNANTTKVLAFIDCTSGLVDIHQVIEDSDLKPAEKAFLAFTFDMINTKAVHKIASVFTFGREDVIPDMFIAIIKGASQLGEHQFPKLTYYLERHIELDGDEHGPLSLEMIAELCGDDTQKWEEVLEVAQQALQYRIQLWDEVVEEIKCLV